MCWTRIVLLWIVVGALGVPAVQAQEAEQTGFIWGTVVDARSGFPVDGANVVLVGTLRAATTDTEGRFSMGELEPKSYTLQVIALGYEAASQAVEVVADDITVVEVRVVPEQVDREGFDLQALRDDLTVRHELGERATWEADVLDTGLLLRQIPGSGARRVGALGMQPSLRGFSGLQVGAYVDGMRMLPGGPFGMDSQLSHVDPAMVRRVEVVEGPYALLWGSGNLSAVRVHTDGSRAPKEGLQGGLQTGYRSNVGALETAGVLAGMEDRFSFRVQGAFRSGSDYEAGGGTTVPGDFRSTALRGYVGRDLTPTGRLYVMGGLQRQRDIDYPGLPYDATTFDAYEAAVRYQVIRSGATLETIDALVYWNTVRHEMDNLARLTRPPETLQDSLELTVEGDVSHLGGRLIAHVDTDSRIDLDLGIDASRAVYDAQRTAVLPDTSFTHPVWPEASLATVGVFAYAIRQDDRVEVAGSGRFDVYRADAGAPSTFFRELLSRQGRSAFDLAQAGFITSASVVARLYLSPRWTLSLGAGTVQRTPTALERFSDRMRFPRADTSLEVIGKPNLEAERSTQADLWLQGGTDRLDLRAQVFGRIVSDHVTLQPTVALQGSLPTSHVPLFQYSSGEARYVGVAVEADYALTSLVTVRTAASYTRGQDVKLDEPAFGVLPLMARAGMRAAALGGRLFAEGTVRLAADKDRVASTLGEARTDAYTTADIRLGVHLGERVAVLLGVDNLTDATYAYPLNARVPGTARAVLEPGRSWYANVRIGW